MLVGSHFLVGVPGEVAGGDRTRPADQIANPPTRRSRRPGSSRLLTVASAQRTI